jgi:hypothetical protein
MKRYGKQIKMDKETLYDNAIQLKKMVNALQKENEKMKSKLIQEKGECNKKDKLLQNLVTQLNGSTVLPSNYKEAALTVSLKKIVKQSELEIAALKEENLRLNRSIKLTKQNELETMNIMLKKECKRLRSMLETLIRDRNPSGFTKLETKLLEQRSIVNELKEKNDKLRYEAEKAKEAERQALDTIKELEEKELKKQRVRVMPKKQDVKEAREEIERLISEKKQLEHKLTLMESMKAETKSNTTNNDELKKEKEANNNLVKQVADLKKRVEESSVKLVEKDKQIREVKATAKEKEEAYMLKELEEKERLTKRIVRLELELSAKTKEATENPKFNNEVSKPLTAIREITKPLVEVDELGYAKHTFRLVLIQQKKSFNELKDTLFFQYTPDESISIKELTKIFQRLNLSLLEAENLARYLIEPRDQQEVVYNKYNEKSMTSIRISLDSLLNPDNSKDIYNDLSSIIQAAINKIKDRYKYIRNAVQGIEGNLDSIEWERICKKQCPELSSIEWDCLLSLIVNERNDLRDLVFKVVLLCLE